MDPRTPMPSGYGPDDEVDHAWADPVWLQVAAIIAARIAVGRYEPGRPIPSARRLQQELDVAVGTARTALRYLEATGRVVVVQGRGAFVSRGE